MFFAFLIAFAIAEPPVKLITKPLPSITEPDWNFWKSVDDAQMKVTVEAWNVLLDHPIDRVYPSQAEKRAAEKKVDAAYATLDANPEAACSSGVPLLKSAKNDWQRLMIGIQIEQLSKKAGEPFLMWAMAKSTTVDDFYEGIFPIAHRMAKRRKTADLPALLLVLRVKDALILYRKPNGVLQPQHSVIFVFGQYGDELLPYLRPLLDHEDPIVRRNTAFLLGYFYDRSIRSKLLTMLEAGDAGSAGAMVALAEWDDREAIAPTIKALSSKDANTRFWAAYALYEHGSKDAIVPLKAALAKETDEKAKHEFQAAIDHLSKGDDSIPSDTKDLAQEELKTTLKTALEKKGFCVSFGAVTKSVGPADIPALIEIQKAILAEPSGDAVYAYTKWSKVIRAARLKIK